ncbi:MAG: Two-component system response regulator [Spirosoma sp.]|nr:Two-component system response regulator [Spirosoma sp.]
MAYSVLIVDDDDDDFMLLSSHIKHCHQNVTLTYAQNGVEATEKLIAGLHPNLIIVDANMPLMSGYELLVWLMKSTSWRHIPVVIWTGVMSDSEVTHYYRAGANTVLLKEKALKSVDAFCQHWFELVQLPELVSTELE